MSRKNSHHSSAKHINVNQKTNGNSDNLLYTADIEQVLGRVKMERVEIQIFNGGTWMTVCNTDNNPQVIQLRMKEEQRSFTGKPTFRVRAILQKNGQLIDIL
jgi:hypothetical protein